METKTFADEIEAAEFVKELTKADNTIDIFKTKSGGFKINWVKNKKYTSFDGKEFTDEVWTTEDGRMIHIQDLEPEHAKNIIRMMLRNSREISKASEQLFEQLSEAFSGLLNEEAPKNRVLH